MRPITGSNCQRFGNNDNSLYNWVNKYSNSNKTNQNNMVNNKVALKKSSALKKNWQWLSSSKIY
jgi:transposase-like protein